MVNSPVSASYRPAAATSYNASGGVMNVTKVPGTTGRYVARFTGLSALLGGRKTVHVSGYANGGVLENTYCKLAAARLMRDSVEVRCFRAGSGTPATAAFTFMVSRDYDYRAFAFAIADLGDVQVTGYAGNAQCKAIAVREASVDVQCYASDGAVKDSRFMVMLHS